MDDGWRVLGTLSQASGFVKQNATTVGFTLFMCKLLQTATEKERASFPTPMSQSIFDTAAQSFLSH